MSNPAASLPSVVKARERLHDIEARLRQFAPELRRLTAAVGETDELLRVELSDRDRFAISLAVVYASLSIELSTIGAPTGSLDPQRQ